MADLFPCILYMISNLLCQVWKFYASRDDGLSYLDKHRNIAQMKQPLKDIPDVDSSDSDDEDDGEGIEGEEHGHPKKKKKRKKEGSGHRKLTLAQQRSIRRISREELKKTDRMDKNGTRAVRTVRWWCRGARMKVEEQIVEYYIIEG